MNKGTLCLLTILLSTTPRFAVATEEACEPRLHANIAAVTEKALTQNRIQLAQVMEMVNSPVPLNPLHAHQPRSEGLALKQFYQQMLPQVKDWPALQAELRRIVERRERDEARVAEARDATAQVFSPRELPLPYMQSKDVLAWLKTRDHRLLYAYYDEQNSSFEVRDFADHRPIWAGSMWDASGFQSLLEDEKGDIKVLSFTLDTRPLGWDDKLLYPGRSAYLRRVADVRTGQMKEDRFFIARDKSSSRVTAGTGSDLLWIHDGTMIALTKKRLEPLFAKNSRFVVFSGCNGENMILRNFAEEPLQIWWAEDGKFAPRLTLPFVATLPGSVAAKQLSDKRFVFAISEPNSQTPLTYYPPSFRGESEGQVLNLPGGELVHHELLLTEEGRILVAAELRVREGRNWVGRKFALFEPARSSDPIFITEGNGRHPHSFRTEEAGGRFFMMISEDQNDFQLYEPLVSSAPLLRLTTPEWSSTFGLYAPNEKQLIFYVGGEGPLRAFSLLNPSRGGG